MDEGGLSEISVPSPGIAFKEKPVIRLRSALWQIFASGQPPQNG